MHEEYHVPLAELEMRFAELDPSPVDGGEVAMIVRRPATLEREVLEVGEFDLQEGLKGDNWRARGSRHTPDGSAIPDAQVALMNVRLLDLLAGTRERWALAGDQLLVDLDLSSENLPPGTQLAIGSAILEVTAQPHNGCAKFLERFGRDALAFISSPARKQLRLRGIYAKVIQTGSIRSGDLIQKVLVPAS